MDLAIRQFGLALPAGRTDGPPAPSNDRRRAFQRARLHTMLVKVLRIVLPLGALVAFSTYFIFAEFSLSVGNFKGTISGVQLQSDRLTMLNPVLEGATADGGTYSVRADRAIQNLAAPDNVELETIRALLTQADGEKVELDARTGTFQTKQQRLTLAGGIDIKNTRNESAKLSRAVINLKRQTVATNEPVRVELTAGRVLANTMLMRLEHNTVRFDGNVRVTIHPRKSASGTSKSLRGTNGEAQ